MRRLEVRVSGYGDVSLLTIPLHVTQAILRIQVQAPFWDLMRPKIFIFGSTILSLFITPNILIPHSFTSITTLYTADVLSQPCILLSLRISPSK